MTFIRNKQHIFSLLLYALCFSSGLSKNFTKIIQKRHSVFTKTRTSHHSHTRFVSSGNHTHNSVHGTVHDCCSNGFIAHSKSNDEWYEPSESPGFSTFRRFKFFVNHNSKMFNYQENNCPKNSTYQSCSFCKPGYGIRRIFKKNSQLGFAHGYLCQQWCCDNGDTLYTHSNSKCILRGIPHVYSRCHRCISGYKLVDNMCLEDKTQMVYSLSTLIIITIFLVWYYGKKRFEKANMDPEHSSPEWKQNKKIRRLSRVRSQLANEDFRST